MVQSLLDESTTRHETLPGRRFDRATDQQIQVREASTFLRLAARAVISRQPPMPGAIVIGGSRRPCTQSQSRPRSYKQNRPPQHEPSPHDDQRIMTTGDYSCWTCRRRPPSRPRTFKTNKKPPQHEPSACVRCSSQQDHEHQQREQQEHSSSIYGDPVRARGRRSRRRCVSVLWTDVPSLARFATRSGRARGRVAEEACGC